MNGDRVDTTVGTLTVPIKGPRVEVDRERGCDFIGGTGRPSVWVLMSDLRKNTVLVGNGLSPDLDVPIYKVG